jgi:hypothetical protein
MGEEFHRSREVDQRRLSLDDYALAQLSEKGEQRLSARSYGEASWGTQLVRCLPLSGVSALHAPSALPAPFNVACAPPQTRFVRRIGALHDRTVGHGRAAGPTGIDQ